MENDILASSSSTKYIYLSLIYNMYDDINRSKFNKNATAKAI